MSDTQVSAVVRVEKGAAVAVGCYRKSIYPNRVDAPGTRAGTRKKEGYQTRMGGANGGTDHPEK